MKSGKEAEKKTTSTSKTAKVVEVLPISKGLLKSTLTYFTTQDLNIGEFIKVPLRKSQVPSIVVDIHSAEDSKTSLKSSSFSLKKIPDSNFKERTSINKSFVNAAQKTAIYYGSRVNTVLDILLPKLILENPELVFSNTNEVVEDKKRPRSEPFILQLDDAERFSQYQNIIRESLARRTSVMFISPTEEDAVRAFRKLSKGISEYSFLFTLGQKQSELKKILKEALVTDKPVLFVTTPAGVSFNKKDLNTIILDRENSRAYRTIKRPYIHLRTFLGYLISNSDKRLILGDSVLSVESLWKEKEGEYRDFFPLKWRLPSKAHTLLVDMKADHREVKEFKMLSPEISELIERGLSEGEKIFLYGARKGLSPTTICEDCGSVLSCKNCDAPVVLYSKNGTKESTMYVCHACRASRPSETSCDSCKSWRLKALGIGIDLIANEVASIFPEAKIQILDKNQASTSSKARKIISEFNGSGQILIGTEMALLYLEEIAYSGIVSLDALFSIPDFSINERMFYLISKIRELSKKGVVIQTRNIGKLILTYASTGNILDFYKSEIDERKELFYPPYSLFIKISPLSPKATSELSSIRDSLLRWKPDIIRGSIVMRLPREDWPDKTLSNQLSLLAHDFSIKVDPESIL